MANPKVHICGRPKVYVPDDDCSECIRELNQFKNEVHQNYYTKTQTDALLDDKQDTLIAGDNITIVGNRISATGGGGSMTKAEILAALGYEEITLAMTDTDDNEHEWTVIAQIQTP